MKIHLHFFIEEIMKKILLIAGSVFSVVFLRILLPFTSGKFPV